MRRIRVLVVDDSILFRNVLVQGLNRDPYIEVVAQAGDPYAARDAILEYRPDVMTLDLSLPRMDGIEFLRRLMPQYPLPVVVVSSLKDKCFDALDAGAVDFVYKPSGINQEQLNEFMRNELAAKVKIASTSKVGSMKKAEMYHNNTGERLSGSDRIIAIGASTGGTEAIYDVLKGFGTDVPGIVMVQHMPPGFTEIYANRLNEQCRVAVKEAVTGDRVIQGRALLAPGDRQMRLVKMADGYQVECRPGEKVNGHCPSVEVLFRSVAQTAGKRSVGIILTGMGGDGAKGLLEMRQAGAATIGQDEASSVVYGMPKVAYDIGAVQYQMNVSDIADKVYSILRNDKTGREGGRL